MYLLCRSVLAEPELFADPFLVCLQRRVLACGATPHQPETKPGPFGCVVACILPEAKSYKRLWLRAILNIIVDWPLQIK